MVPFLVFLLASLSSATGPPPQDASGVTPDPVVASGAGIEIHRSEHDRVLLERHGMSETGREALDMLVKTRVLDLMALDHRLEISAEDISARWDELDRRAKSEGRPAGLLGEIEAAGIGIERFRELLRLWIVQERLAKEAIGIDAGGEVSTESQEIWWQQEIDRRGLRRYPPPWKDGRVATSGAVEIQSDEFAAFLRDRLAPDLIEEAAWHLLLLEGIERRMPDLAPAARARAVEEELVRRREEHQAAHPGITFEQRLGVAGRSLEGLRGDPSVHIAALSRLWVDRNHGDAGLRRTYEDERAYFEGLFGRAVQAHMLFLRAGRFANELNARTFRDAEAQLEGYRSYIGSGDDFRALVAKYSEQPASRKNSGKDPGALGWITRAAPNIPREIREAVYAFVDTHDELPAGGTLIPSVRLDSGCAMLWLSTERESPTWAVMREYVHKTLRRRFLEQVMPRSRVKLFSPSRG